MTPRFLVALLSSAAVLASGQAAAAEVNQAQALVDSGGLSGDELAYWTASARRYRDQVEWREVVERGTKRLQEMEARAAELDRQAAEVALIAKGLEQDRLRRERHSDDWRQMMREHYGMRFEGDPEPLDPKATSSSGPLQDYLKQQERAEARIRAKAQVVGAGLKTAQAVDRWVQVVVDSTGEVIVNDPVDVAHARLEDLAIRQAELEARLKGKLDPAEAGAIVDELIALEVEVDRAMAHIGGYVFRLRSPRRHVCFPPPVPDQPNPVFNCQYWAVGVPRTIDSGQKIVLDRVMLDIDEDARDMPYRASVSYYWRYAGDPPRDEAGSSYSGEIRHSPSGALSLVFTETDENGEERERSFPLDLGTGTATATLPGFGYGPYSLSFRRDPEAYVPWADYQAAAQGKAPDRRTARPSDKYDVGPPSQPTQTPTRSEPMDDDYLAPLPAPPAPVPAPSPAQTPEELWNAPIASGSGSQPPPASPPAQTPEELWNAPIASNPTPPAADDDDYLAPLTPP